MVTTLVKNYGFVASDRQVMLPQAQVTNPALADIELDQALLALKGWEPVESLVPGDYPKARHELRKSYRFPTFRAAIDFMQSAVDTIQAVQHHPRWENQWRTVTVFLSTWDVGHKITSLDIDLARRLDDVYDTLKAKRRRSATLCVNDRWFITLERTSQPGGQDCVLRPGGHDACLPSCLAQPQSEPIEGIPRPHVRHDDPIAS